MVGDGSLIIQTDIDNYSWDCPYRPKTQLVFRYVEEKGFHVRMRCYETDVRAVNTEPDSPVYEDSCMECFLNFYPDSSKLYVNFETNANGTMLCQVGEGKCNRTFIRDMGLMQPETEADTGDGFWEISYLIPLSLIDSIYGQSAFCPGQQIKGNFYKCGDLTQMPHYGCWSPILHPKPNFHMPEYFGSLYI